LKGEAIDIDKLTKLEIRDAASRKRALSPSVEWFLALSCFWML